MAESWHTLAGRLRWAIFEHQPPQGRERGLRLFQRRMEAHAQPDTSTSLSAIQGYLRGDPEPSLRFIAEAAQLLGLRAEWLAWGVGAPTEEEEALRRETPEEELGRIAVAVYDALRMKPQGRTAEVWAPMLRQTSIAFQVHRNVWTLLQGEHGELSRQEATEAVAAAIAAPLGVLGLDPYRIEDLADYIQSAATVLHRAISHYQYPTEPDQEEV